MLPNSKHCEDQVKYKSSLNTIHKEQYITKQSFHKLAQKQKVNT